MRKNRLGLIGASVVLAVLSLFVMALLRPTPSLASPLTTLNVKSNPAGVVLASPTCFGVSAGTCGTTNWTSTSSSNIPSTVYVYPTTATIGGTYYTLDPSSLSGCNQGTNGSLPNVCKVSVAFGTAATISANYSVATPPVATCTASAPNLVKNPSFESTINVQNFTFTFNGWYIWDSFPGNRVTDWRRAEVTAQPGVVASSIAPAGTLLAFQGSKFAIIEDTGHDPNHPPGPYQGLIGKLSSATIVGASYVLSAHIATHDSLHSPGFELQLRNSASGALSAPVQASITNTGNWTLISGGVAANDNYDEFIVRYIEEHQVGQVYGFGWGFVDAVNVCKAGTSLPWWNSGLLSGAVLVTLIIISGLILWRNPGFLKNLSSSNKIILGIVALGISAAAIYVAGTDGGVWKSKNKPSTNNVTTSTSNDQTQSKTCKDKETVAAGYKLFRSETYKYCIQYPLDWPVDQAKADMITFGTVNPESTPGWFKVKYFSEKNTTERSEEIVANFIEPGGPCTASDVMIGDETAKKLDCIGASFGEHQIFYLVSENKNLIELSYIEGTDTDYQPYHDQYGVMVEGFLTDMVANQ